MRTKGLSEECGSSDLCQRKNGASFLLEIPSAAFRQVVKEWRAGLVNGGVPSGDRLIEHIYTLAQSNGDKKAKASMRWIPKSCSKPSTSLVFPLSEQKRTQHVAVPNCWFF